MGSFIVLVKQSWHRLIPFAASIVVYSVLVQFTKSGLWWTAVCKCAPIVSLQLYVLFFGFQHIKLNTYPRKILLGLFFSCIGDALLDFDLFEFGVGGFLLAQLCYIWAFGWQPFMWWIGVLLYVCAAALTGVLLKHLDQISLYGLPIYALALSTMSWRALARIRKIDERSLLLTRILCGIGSVLFVISDSIIAFNKFYVTIPNSGYYIMITYYIAQLGITLSTLPSPGQDAKMLICDAQPPENTESDGRFVAKSSRLTD
ncbi:lysoplasmalogenase-like protein TMEM86A [Hermetia illucens]|uniref:lysoplasmalogenase-like protein TMEM86A n=1 Tax=Hermetia illucens TaxID=343691 RepID=UPI0018CC2046|nr:lysoplasmalogenase-like protein TMEM86A [Hermetia illucens]